MSSFTIIIPAVPPSGNAWARMHWRKRMDLVASWFYLVSSVVHTSQKWNAEVVTLDVTIYFAEKRRRDLLNFAVGADKLIIDHLVNLGVIPDDDSEHLRGFSISLEVDKKNPRTVVTLHDISPRR